jgi:4a-hydroxytetrahydrobiopterin dehydratase
MEAPSPRKMSAPANIRIPQGWNLAPDGKSIQVEVKTKDFLDAIDLFEWIGDIAEDLEHHPDLHLEKYNHVRIVTYSHDVGHLTDRDEKLATLVTQLLVQKKLLPE